MAAATDWRQILAEHDQFLALAPNPVVALNRAVDEPFLAPAGGVDPLRRRGERGRHADHGVRRVTGHHRTGSDVPVSSSATVQSRAAVAASRMRRLSRAAPGGPTRPKCPVGP
jgi:hypothetical protein